MMKRELGEHLFLLLENKHWQKKKIFAVWCLGAL